MVWEHAVSATPWLAVGRRGMVLEQRTHATPAARRTRCFVAPAARHTHWGHSSTGQSMKLPRQFTCPNSRADGMRITGFTDAGSSPAGSFHSPQFGAYGPLPRATGTRSSTEHHRAPQSAVSPHELPLPDEGRTVR